MHLFSDCSSSSLAALLGVGDFVGCFCELLAGGFEAGFLDDGVGAHDGGG